MVKKNRVGEVATIVALGSLIILGLSSLVSSVFLKNKQTTKTKAEEKCVYKDYDECRASGCSDSECVRCDDYTYKCIGTSSTTDSCQCLSGKATGPCGDVNPCGSEMGGCSEYGAWKTDCTGSNQNCPADAGVAYTSWCDGKNWRFQYPNCVTWCKVEYLNNPPPASQKDPLCQDKSPGDFITDSFNGTLPTGVEKGVDKSLPSYKYVSCDGNVGVWVEVQPFCDQFGKIQWSPGRKSDVSCIPPNINISKTPVGSFWLTAKVEAKKDDKKIKFDTTVIFNSTDCDGDITLYRNGGLVAHNRWNSGGKQSFTFEYYPEWTGSISLGPGEKETVVYQGRIDNCPRSKVPLQDTVSCEFGVSPYGEPWVRGQGCNLVNFDEVVKITPLLTPVTQPRVTWANPPPITPKITPFIFKTSTNPSGSPGGGLRTSPSSSIASAPTIFQCTNYGVNPNSLEDCPAERTEECNVEENGVIITGIRYVKIECGSGSSDSCQYRCKTITDLTSKGNNYSGSCGSDATCITTTSSFTNINVTVKVLNQAEPKKWIHAVGVLYGSGPNDYIFKKFNSPADYSLSQDFIIRLPQFPQRDIKFTAFVDYSDKRDSVIGKLYSPPIKKNSFSLENMEFGIMIK
jgi:hypothetical protein